MLNYQIHFSCKNAKVFSKFFIYDSLAILINYLFLLTVLAFAMEDSIFPVSFFQVPVFPNFHTNAVKLSVVELSNSQPAADVLMLCNLRLQILVLVLNMTYFLPKSCYQLNIWTISKGNIKFCGFSACYCATRHARMQSN